MFPLLQTDNKQTQPTRYMGIETVVSNFDCKMQDMTQPTRYMGIETLRTLYCTIASLRHNLLAIWVLKL